MLVNNIFIHSFNLGTTKNGTHHRQMSPFQTLQYLPITDVHQEDGSNMKQNEMNRPYNLQTRPGLVHMPDLNEF